MTKYNNKITIVDGIKFHSKLEANCYILLRNSKLDFTRQPVMLLQEKFTTDKLHLKNQLGIVKKVNISAIKYIGDFLLSYNDITYIVEAKGVETALYKVKEKIALKLLTESDEKYIFVKIISIAEMSLFIYQLLKTIDN